MQKKAKTFRQVQKPKNSNKETCLIFPTSQSSQGSPLKLRLKHKPQTSETEQETVNLALNTMQSSQQGSMIRVKEIIKVCKSKNRIKKTKVFKNLEAFQCFSTILISPIPKVSTAFVNSEDKSLINALDLR
jgi:hypothetical protein